MFSQLFEERDRKVSVLIKLGDCLGRSLRENVILFSIDSHNKEVTYLTESNMVISGHYQIGSDVLLRDIQIRDTSIFEDSRKYDTFLTAKVHSLVESVYGNDYSEADGQFSDLLSLWETRLKFDNVKNKLAEKAERVSFNTGIIKSNEFQRALEIAPQLVKFLKENREKFSGIAEIKNAVCLSETVATAFNFPHLSYDDLTKSKSYKLKDGVSDSIYEMICKQELLKKELVESRRAFATVWATSPAIVKLAGLVYDTPENIVAGLSEALKEVPYLAFASKKSLTETFTSCLDEGIGVSEEDIRQFSSKIFEYKKEIRDLMTDLLSEKYGVNLQNLKEPPSFNSLVNTQILIFEAISRLAPNGGIIKKVMSELSESLKGKTGVESIDVNDFINALFVEAEYGFILEKTQSLNRYTKVDMKRLQKDMEDIKSTVDLMKGKLSGGEGGEKPEAGGEEEEELGGEDEEAGGPPEKGGEEGMPKKGESEVTSEKPLAGKDEGPPEKGGEEAPTGNDEEIPGKEEKPAPGEEVPPGEEGGELEGEEPGEEADVMADLQDLESMIDNLASELGFGADEDPEATLDTEKKTKVEKGTEEDNDTDDED